MKNSIKKALCGILLASSLMAPRAALAKPLYSFKITVRQKTDNGYKILKQFQRDKIPSAQFNFLIKNENGKMTVITQKAKEYEQKKVEEDKTAIRKDNKSTAEKEMVSQDEKAMLDMVNEERKEKGLAPLQMDSRLVDIARKKSQDMITNNYFGHTSPTYGTPFEALRKNGIDYHYAGENLAGAPTVERAHDALMKSPGHRANILNPNFTAVGIGIVEGGPYGKMYTQVFTGTK